MALIRSLILKNPNQNIIHIMIVKIPQSSFEIGEAKYAILDIAMEDKTLWHIQLVKFLGYGILPVNLT